jgi:hypothetical protein
MYFNKEELKSASIEDILKELKIVDEELFCIERALPSAKLYILRIYSKILLDEIKSRIEKIEFGGD